MSNIVIDQGEKSVFSKVPGLELEEMHQAEEMTKKFRAVKYMRICMNYMPDTDNTTKAENNTIAKLQMNLEERKSKFMPCHCPKQKK